MPLPRDYSEENCALARALEIVGERWTLLIVRDAMYGVTRFSDFADHLGIARPILARRLAALVEEGLMTRTDGRGRSLKYELTDKGLALWPTLRALIGWGDDFYSPDGVRRYFLHATDQGRVDAVSVCSSCHEIVPVEDIVVTTGPGLRNIPPKGDPISKKLREPRRLVETLTI